MTNTAGQFLWADLWATPSDYTALELRWDEVADANGWRESRAAHCPRVITGGRCLHRYKYPRLCVCDQWAQTYGLGVVDHARMWLTHDGGYVLTFEPYGMPDDERLTRFRADAVALGLTVTVGDRSPYYPGSTTLLIVSKAETNEGGPR